MRDMSFDHDSHDDSLQSCCRAYYTRYYLEANVHEVNTYGISGKNKI